MTFLNQLFNLENKVALLTGGGGILAGEMAKGFLSTGVKVVLLDINETNLSKRVDTLNEFGNEVSGIKCNVLEEKSLEDVNQQVLEKYGRIDILINAAGGNIPGATIGLDQTIFDLKIEELQKVTNLNFYGTVLPTLIFGKTMSNQKNGSIINISSMATFRSITRVVGYSAAKASVDNFTKWMAVELAQKFGNGIRVNAIAPGFLLTDQNRTLLNNEDGSLTQRGKDIIHMTPFKRFGDPDELIGSILWLASDASKFVTGTIIPIDGGFSIFSGV
ncbi:MAG: SDR family oxidoreductase [Melioribacteraceae bacterium]|jgi:NAD(P)-dependent dehydrogenase (short-subunit alcohol dehydrogenase family)